MALTPDDLVEIHEITQREHTSFRCLDQKRWEETAPRGSVEGLTPTASWWRTDGVSSPTG